VKIQGLLPQNNVSLCWFTGNDTVKWIRNRGDSQKCQLTWLSLQPTVSSRPAHPQGDVSPHRKHILMHSTPAAPRTPHAGSDCSTETQTYICLHGPGEQVQGGRGWHLPLRLAVGAWWTRKTSSAECSDQRLCHNTCLGNTTCYFCMKTQVQKRNKGLAHTQAQEESSTSAVKPLPKITHPILGTRKCFPYLCYKCNFWALTAGH